MIEAHSTLKIDMSTTRNDYLNAIDWAEVKGERKGYAKGVAEGRAEGVAKGREVEKEAIAKAMKEDGLDVETIVLCTGLDKETIQPL